MVPCYFLPLFCLMQWLVMTGPLSFTDQDIWIGNPRREPKPSDCLLVLIWLGLKPLLLCTACYLLFFAQNDCRYQRKLKVTAGNISDKTTKLIFGRDRWTEMGFGGKSWKLNSCRFYIWQLYQNSDSSGSYLGDSFFHRSGRFATWTENWRESDLWAFCVTWDGNLPARSTLYMCLIYGMGI